MNNDQLSRKRPVEESSIPNKERAIARDYILNADGTVLLDHKGAPVTVDKFLGTKPLRSVISQRAGPGGRKLDYMAGETVTQTLNDAFGYDGWSMEVKDKTREESIKDDKGRYHVAYTATVRITLARSGAFREDCGAGDAIDRSLGTASGHAIKGAITDAMKRAARHFGEKTGNALYHSGFTANNAPMTLKDAFEQFDVQRAKTRFGFEKDRAANQNACSTQQGDATTKHNRNQTNSTSATSVKEEVKNVQYKPTPYTSNQPKQTPTNSYVAQQTAKPMTQTKPTQAAINTSAVVQKTPYSTNNAKPAAAPYVTPYNGANAGATSTNQNRNRTAVEYSQYSATPSVEKNTFTNNSETHSSGTGKENSNPQQNMTGQQAASTPSGGLNLPPRPGTSRAPQQSNIADGMLGLASSILAMNGQSGSNVIPSHSKTGNTMVKNPYNALG